MSLGTAHKKRAKGSRADKDPVFPMASTTGSRRTMHRVTLVSHSHHLCMFLPMTQAALLESKQQGDITPANTNGGTDRSDEGGEHIARKYRSFHLCGERYASSWSAGSWTPTTTTSVFSHGFSTYALEQAHPADRDALSGGNVSR